MLHFEPEALKTLKPKRVLNGLFGVHISPLRRRAPLGNQAQKGTLVPSRVHISPLRRRAPQNIHGFLCRESRINQREIVRSGLFLV